MGSVKSSTYNLDSSIPRAGSKGILRDHIPVNCINLSVVLLVRLDREVVQGDVVEFDRTIATARNNLVLMPFRPCSIVDRILSIEPGREVSLIACHSMH